MGGIAGAPRSPLVRDPAGPESLTEGHEEDSQVENKAPARGVLGVQLDLSRDGDFVASIDLGPAGDAWPQPVYAGLGAKRDEVVLIVKGGPGTDEAHLTGKDAEELGKLIKARASQDPPDGGYPPSGI